MSIGRRVIAFSLAGMILVGLVAELTLPIRIVALTIFGTPVGLTEGIFGTLWDSVHVSGWFVRDEGSAYARAKAQKETRGLLADEVAVIEAGEVSERRESGEGEIGEVVRRSFTAIEQSFVVSASENVREGMSVFTDGTLIGRVASVTRNRAVVELLWLPGKESPALLSSQGVPIVLVGQGAGFWTAKVPRSLEVKVGDVIVSNHAERSIIGIVHAVKPESASPFTDFIVRSPVNATIVQWVTMREDAQ